MTRPLAFRIPAPITAILIMMLVSIPASAAAGKFLTGPQPGDPGDIAVAYITGNLDALGLTAADLDDMVVRDRFTTRHNGITHLYFQQRLDGIEVHDGIISVNVARDGSIINIGNGFVGALTAMTNAGIPVLTDQAAIERAAEHFGLIPGAGDLTLLSDDGGADRRATFAGERLSRRDIPVRLVYQPAADGSVRLAWQTSLDMPHNPDYWRAQVDAWTGEVLSVYNFTNYDSYLAIPLPFSDPEDAGGQSVVADPADAIASPFGWHDTDGSAGAESNLTRGNNVNAQEDLDGNNSGGLSPDGGASRDFAFAFNPALQPATPPNLEASIVNLFFINNVMHDVTYWYGFDEPAGNFQFNNYGNGGADNDPVIADAQDDAEGITPEFNNANFQTPADGFSGRMQMYQFKAPRDAKVTVNSPPSIAGDYEAYSSDFGPQWGSIAAITDDVELVNDNTGTTTDGCEALVGFTAGNIALIDRGTCDFEVKVDNAENAMASAVIIANNQPGIIHPGGDHNPFVAIPSLLISQDDGDTIKGELGGGVNATLDEDPTADPRRDSDFDNGIIAHEYGHGISNRLTGGPGSLCLNGSEQAGEGWSDFWTMVLSAKATDTPELSKGVGNYPGFGPINGPGIRNYPYSTDLGVNPQTYADIATTNAPHGVGEIWMSMVWEVYWELVTKHGFDCEFCGGTGGNNLTIQLVVDGMKLQGCNPTFVIARDAILDADAANNGGANACEIWRGFAKRGLGTLAIDGTNNVGDETEDFSIPGSCPAVAPSIFTDGFECGNISRWGFSVGD